jgi:azurin
MAHNFVLLAKNTDPAKFIEAGQSETATDYIARVQTSRVLAKTKLTGPGETDTITFRAPSVPGPYDYVCTFPGHYVSGMKGVMTVVP